MSRKARKMAESAVDKAMQNMPVLYKSAAYREALISAALPTAELAAKSAKALSSAAKALSRARAQSEHVSAMLERERFFLERVEADYTAKAAQGPFPWQHQRTPIAAVNGNHHN